MGARSSGELLGGMLNAGDSDVLCIPKFEHLTVKKWLTVEEIDTFIMEFTRQCTHSVMH